MKNKILLLIYVLIGLEILLVIFNYDEYTAYFSILFGNVKHLSFNIILILIIYLLFYNFKQKIQRAEKKASDKHNEALSDNITGVYNRAGLNEYGLAKWEDAKNNSLSFATIFIDVDKLKLFNDTYGHLVGDSVIKEVANALKNSIRLTSDIIIRYGGDEFLILLSDVKKPALKMLAKRIQSNIKAIQIDEINEEITLSIGIVLLEKIHADDKLEDIIHLADVNLYEVKNKGGNAYILCNK